MHFYLAICFKQHNNIENSIAETQYISQLFEMHNLLIMWRYALRFVTCKVSVDAFSLFYSKLLSAKLSLFVMVRLLLNCIGKLLAYVAALFVTSVCKLLSLRG